MVKKKKILMILAACGLAHTMHGICLGRGLTEKGHEIFFAAKEKLLDVIGKYRFKKLYKIRDKADTAKSLPELLELITERSYVERCMNDELRVIELVKPELIISDFRLTARFSAHLKKVPCAVIVPHTFFLKEVRENQASRLDYFGQTNHSSYTELNEVLSRIAKNEVLSKVAKKVHWLFKKVEMRPAKNFYDIMVSPLCTLIASIPALSLTDKLPNYAHFVGPLSPNLCGERLSCKESIVKLRKFGIKIHPRDKIVHIGFSSGAIQLYPEINKEWLKLASEAFKESDFKVILVDITSRKAIHSHNIFIVPFVPANLILSLRNVVSITNAPKTTSLESIFYTTPMLHIPLQIENIYIAQVLKTLGASDILLEGQISVPSIREKVCNLFYDPAYNVALRRINKELKKFISPKVAIESLRHHQLI